MSDRLTLPRIKVCGMTSAEDVRQALHAGADALGFVHYAPSPRNVALADAAGWIAEVPEGVATVLVVVDASPQGARAALDESGARWLQLCGTERAEDWAQFDAPILRRIAVDDGAAAELERWRDIATGFVLDHPQGPGGTGEPVDLARAAQLARSAPCLLAGGLGPENVAARILCVMPAGVDASSRLEARPGEKDARLVQTFVNRARVALAERETIR